MRIIDPTQIAQPDLYALLVGIVAPRPIAFVSTVDTDGNPNLAPYSFYNLFSSAPPILVFSSNRRAGSNTTKDTLNNVMATREVVVNVVTYPIVRQMSLASIEYPSGVNEFEKAGFTPLPSDLVKPFRVKESPAQMECKVIDIITLGEQAGAGHLIICEIVRIHASESIFDEQGRVDPHRIDLMGRLGRAFYVRASDEAVHTLFRPLDKLAIGFDQLPETVRWSKVLTGNDLGLLAGINQIPSNESLDALAETPEIAKILQDSGATELLHHLAQIELSKENVDEAAKLVWLGDRK
jgi:flavin reductase (DIM6/NTAB) family NADH-FMN oxidoreductase RutF